MLQLNKERLREWVKALRSGEYQQTRHTLRDNRGYCCLGVACDVAIKNKWVDAEWGKEGFLWDDAEGTPHCEGEELPEPVQAALGLREADPVISSPDFIEGSAIILNDDGVEFSRIADLIEAHYDLKEPA